MSKGKRIGLVLSRVPPYSETFFKTKINGLAGEGFTVYLFAAGIANHELACTLVRPYPVFHSAIGRMLSGCVVLLMTFVRSPARVLRLARSERKAGSGAMGILRKIYLNAHILPRSLDWLHFGFATMAIGKEAIAGIIGARMAVSFRGYDLNVYPLRNPGCYTRLWSHVDQVHSISLYLLEKAYQLGLSRETHALVIRPAIGFDDDGEIRTGSLQLPLRILTVARLTWIKGLEYGIKAIAILKTMNIPCTYTIIGEGPDREKLLFEIEDLGLGEKILLAGVRSHHETLQAMKQSDIYLQPSLNEGFCNAVMEAQANGCWCTVSDVGGLPENILDQVTGWLVPPRSAEQIAGAVARIVGMTMADRAIVSRNARKRVYNEFRIDSHVGNWKKFYE